MQTHARANTENATEAKALILSTHRRHEGNIHPNLSFNRGAISIHFSCLRKQSRLDFAVEYYRNDTFIKAQRMEAVNVLPPNIRQEGMSSFGL